MSQKLVRDKRGQGHFMVATRITRMVPPEAHFVAELTDEGILLRYVGDARDNQPPVELPKWARNGAS